MLLRRSWGRGMLLRDEAGQIILSACRVLAHCSGPEEAELCDCMEGLALACEYSDSLVMVETDCVAVIRAGSGAG